MALLVLVAREVGDTVGVEGEGHLEGVEVLEAVEVLEGESLGCAGLVLGVSLSRYTAPLRDCLTLVSLVSSFMARMSLSLQAVSAPPVTLACNTPRFSHCL